MVSASAAGQRLDIFLAGALCGFSRSLLSQLIHDGRVLVNRAPSKSSYRLKAGDQISVDIPPPAPARLVPAPVDFITIFEDEDLLVISKPPGLVVHPACGHRESTLVHGLLFACKDLAGIGGLSRPGIVHRLDKDTSGLMVVAKNDRSHLGLVRLFKERRVEKIYRAILSGRPRESAGRIALSIGRHPVHRQKMAVVAQGGREAATRWQVLEELAFAYTYVELRPETGRTHQIRVHMSYLGHPVAGDRLYGAKAAAAGSGVLISRQCLHALSLAFPHPISGRPMSFTAPLWPDMAELLKALRVKD